MGVLLFRLLSARRRDVTHADIQPVRPCYPQSPGSGRAASPGDTECRVLRPCALTTGWGASVNSQFCAPCSQLAGATSATSKRAAGQPGELVPIDTLTVNAGPCKPIKLFTACNLIGKGMPGRVAEKVEATKAMLDRLQPFLDALTRRYNSGGHALGGQTPVEGFTNSSQEKSAQSAM